MRAEPSLRRLQEPITENPFGQHKQFWWISYNHDTFLKTRYVKLKFLGIN